MKTLSFPADDYIYNSETKAYEYVKRESSIVGKLEFIWTAVQGSMLQDLTKRDHKTNKALKSKIRAITKHKDQDKDSRISLGAAQELILEESELDLLKRHIESGIWSSRASEDLMEVWDIIDKAAEYQIPKPVLIEIINEPTERFDAR